MNYRKVTTSDFDGIASLYEECFGIKFSPERYNYWYKYGEGYSSIVYEENGVISGHNAFVINNYVLDGKEIKVALSAAGMVSPSRSKNPGTFLKLIQENTKLFEEVDVLIAFPNKKAELFWTKVLKFDTVYQNYYYVTPKTLVKNASKVVQFSMKRTEAFLNKRTELNTRYNYQQMTINLSVFIYKEYNGNIELVYISRISEDLVKFLETIFNQGFKRVNIISIYGDVLKEFGFVLSSHNVFVYKWLNKSLAQDVFDCQMIDSDVF